MNKTNITNLRQLQETYNLSAKTIMTEFNQWVPRPKLCEFLNDCNEGFRCHMDVSDGDICYFCDNGVVDYQVVLYEADSYFNYDTLREFCEDFIDIFDLDLY